MYLAKKINFRMLNRNESYYFELYYFCGCFYKSIVYILLSTSDTI